MHLIVVTDDVLYPTNSGGRAALLGECEALLAAGCDLTLVISHRNLPTASEIAQHESLTPEVVFMKRAGFLKTSLLHPFRPFQLQSRGVVRDDVARALCRPDTVGVIASHEWTIPLARSIARPHNLEVVLRSHNDEVEYMRALARSASGLRKVYCWAESARLRLMLKTLYKDLRGVAVLSPADSESYQEFGLQPKHVPAVLFRERDSVGTVRHDPPEGAGLLFVGALDMPQAVEGLRWFCAHVLPRVQATIPNVELCVAGRRPSREVSEFLTALPGVRFFGEVGDLEDLYSANRVFINPVFSGSGVNMKVGPPASRGIPVVTTSTGSRGLDHLAPGFAIADTEAEFASACIALLVDDSSWRERSRELQIRAGFVSSDSVAESLLQMFDDREGPCAPQKPASSEAFGD